MRAKARSIVLTPNWNCGKGSQAIFLDVGQLIAMMGKDVLPNSHLGKALSYAERRSFP
jgi:hypothetical protein